MSSMFATSRFPRADQPNAVMALGKHDRQQSALLGIGEQHRAGLTHRVSGIIDHESQRVVEGRRRFVERDPVLLRVGRCLLGVPFEGEGHAGSLRVRGAFRYAPNRLAHQLRAVTVRIAQSNASTAAT